MERMMSEYWEMLREKMGNQRLLLPGVRAIILNEKGEILLQKRGDFGVWGLPAGSVNLGESAYDCLKRETKEETGLDVLSATPMGIYTHPKYSLTYPNGDQIQPFTLAFIVHGVQGELQADGEESLDLKYFPMDGLPDDILPIHRETIQDFETHDGNFILK
jgi:ADP-ribose pyrophosphatase YjhB (NUDIX family)